jgi:chloramphenicol O-acetyltransferase
MLFHENRVALMETMSIEKKEMYNDFIKEYKDELEEVKQQMEETSKSLKKLEDKLDDE